MASADKVMVCVSDTGVGMSSEDITLALTAFGQIDSSLDRQNEGTGLGLPIAKALIELQGGTFILRSELGRGTDIVLLFTLAQKTVEPVRVSEQIHDD